MKILLNDTEFNNLQTRQLVPLECEYCHKQFYQIKKIVLESLKGTRGKRGSSFCSQDCINNMLYPSKIIAHCLTCNEIISRVPSAIGKHTFCSSKCSAIFFGNLKRKPKPQKSIQPPKRLNNCLFCGKETKNNKYCNGTCRNNHLNKNIKGNKSKAERLLVSSLKLNFPKWEIVENDRKILNGLELDVFIPSIKLAIEWNGIFHYEPIRGNDVLEGIINKDNIKIQKCKELGIELLIVCDRTSHKKFIEKTINELIEKLTIIYKSGTV